MQIVVIGAVAAGMSAASKAKRAQPQARVQVFGREEHVSYAACGLPYYIGGVVAQQRNLIARTREQFAQQGIEVNTGHDVTQILPQQQQICVQTPEGREVKVPYDKLIIATGARPKRPSIPGLDLDGVFTVSTIPETEKIRKAITAGVKRAVIIGGGYIGLETVDALHLQGVEITLLQRSHQVAGTIDPDMAELVQEHMQSKGVDVQTQVQVEEIFGSQTVQGVRTDRGDIPCDLVIVAVGVQPNSELAQGAGIELGVKGAIQVNAKMETSIPNIYAAGDCAVAWHRLYQDNAYIPLGTTANKQGRIAGENAVGGQAEFDGIVGTGIMKVLDLGIGRTGLSTREANHLGKGLETVTVDVSNRARYYPNPGQGRVKLLFDGEGKIWGAQLVGADNFAKRIDVFATALHASFSVQDLAGLDLSYSPPFSPVWDPALVAANVAQSKLEK